MLVIIFILVVAPFLYYKYVNRIKGLPPGPTPLPLIGEFIFFPLKGYLESLPQLEVLCPCHINYSTP